MDVCEEYQKEQKLARLLEEIGSDQSAKILVFTETKRKCDELTRLMRKDGWPAMCIHGDKQQSERDWVLGEFKSGATTILVATDVAARGLDVDDVKFVINYDYPNNSEDYIHRIGFIKENQSILQIITVYSFRSHRKKRQHGHQLHPVHARQCSQGEGPGVCPHRGQAGCQPQVG